MSRDGPARELRTQVVAHVDRARERERKRGSVYPLGSALFEIISFDLINKYNSII